MPRAHGAAVSQPFRRVGTQCSDHWPTEKQAGAQLSLLTSDLWPHSLQDSETWNPNLPSLRPAPSASKPSTTAKLYALIGFGTHWWRNHSLFQRSQSHFLQIHDYILGHITEVSSTTCSNTLVTDSLLKESRCKRCSRSIINVSL